MNIIKELEKEHKDLSNLISKSDSFYDSVIILLIEISKDTKIIKGLLKKISDNK